MKVRCPNCLATLVFDAASGKMECNYCGSFFSMEDVAEQEERAEQEEETEQKSTSESDTMECNIYTCGAELAINGVESSTFCAYCGQPTIVFSRVSQALKPELIIPFKVQKEQAVEAIRKRFNQGFFIPKEIKNFEVDRVRGIYIPYWLFDSYYYDRQLIKGKVGSGKNSRIRYYMREAECNFSNLTLDASSNLNDESSQRLEPYDMTDLRPFEVGYMSGYYADRYDMGNKDLHSLASQRAGEMFNEQTLASCNARNKSIVESNPRMEIQREIYAMFPAWFMTFRYHNMPYTMLVNGQTGKLVGAVPYDKKKVKGVAIGIFILAALVCIPLAIGIFTAAWGDGENFYNIFIMALAALAGIGLMGFNNWERLRTSSTLTSSSDINKFARDRQERTGGDL